MNHRKPFGKLLGVGIVGTVLMVLCCFTPVLVILLGAVGLSAWVGGLDAVLLPIFVVCVGITGFALWRRRGGGGCCETAPPGDVP